MEELESPVINVVDEVRVAIYLVGQELRPGFRHRLLVPIVEKLLTLAAEERLPNSFLTEPHSG